MATPGIGGKGSLDGGCLPIDGLLRKRECPEELPVPLQFLGGSFSPEANREKLPKIALDRG
jgi:hypothetical protein